MSKFFDKFKHKDKQPKQNDNYVEDVYVDKEFSTNSYDQRTMTEPKVTTTVKKFSPTSYNDLQQAADALLAYKHVVISFKDMSDDDYRRSLNFMSGFVYALNGNINKIEPKVIEFIVRR